MAVISDNAFNPLRQYIGVRLQQGVPIVDADWNELEDIRKFELRAFLKWFVGNGTPQGNDGFRVEGTALSNDFTIRSGVPAPPGGLGNLEVGLQHLGRCIVDGLDVVIQEDMNFSTQPLHTSQPGSTALAARLGVPQIQPLTPPVANGTVTAYLDVWERLVTTMEDPSLVHPGLGTESCARLKREWAVRVRNSTSAPVRGDADFITGHSYYALANIARRNGDAHVNAADVQDLREMRLVLPPETLAADVLGISMSDYRRGLGRPVVSLRAALNAMLRGDLPSTAAELLSSGPPNNLASKAVFQDASGNLWAFFTSNRSGNQNIFLRRFLAGTQVWGPDETITTDPASDSEPVGLVDSTGDVWILWNSNRGAANQNLWMKRFRVATAAWDADTNLTSSAGDNFQQVVLEDNNTNLWVFWMSMRSANKPSLWLKRYLRATNTWTPDPTVPLISSPAPAVDQLPSAAIDSSNTVYLLWQSNRNAPNDHIFWNRLDSNGNLLGPDQQVVPASPNRERDPVLLVDSRNQVWAFWRADIGGVFQIQAARFDRNASTWTLEPNLSGGTLNNFSPVAVEDNLGNVWAIWRSVRSGGQEVLVYRIFNPATATWSIERVVTPIPGDHKLSTAVSTASGAIVILWTSTTAGTSQAMYRQFFPAI
jgi:hypothetical protein